MDGRATKLALFSIVAATATCALAARAATVESRAATDAAVT